VIRRGAPEGSPGVQRQLPVRELVPGDLVVLAAGDLVPADCRLLSARALMVNQAAMTGEALPVEKSADLPKQASQAGVDPLHLPHLLFMGSSIVSGAATALVLNTGSATYFGAIAGRITAKHDETSAFQAGVNSVSWLLIRFALVMAPLVLLVSGFTKGNWGEACLFALSVAVGLTPEMLPMIVTSTLAKGAVALARKKVVVKRLDAIQNFGAMDILCTDKTGTLTEDHIVLARHLGMDDAPSQDVLRLAFLNSHYQTGLNNLLDRAVLERAAALGINETALAGWSKLDELPFDFERRRMSVLVGDGSRRLLVCKGAVEEVLAACATVRIGDSEQPLDTAARARALALMQALNGEGLRLVAVASRDLAADRCAAGDESGLTLQGLLAFFDPPKASTAPALRALARLGVEVKVLTGDNTTVAATICRGVGLPAGTVLTGAAIDTMDETSLRQAARAHTVFAKLSPLHKERIVRALRGDGHVVGFLGDGINDAPALRAADIGISVDSAVDIAREAADIILLEKSLMVLESGITEGRRTFSNMLKYIRMTASSNFGNVFSVLAASAFLPFLPMLPLQLLVQNLLYDVSQIAIPFDKVDAELVAQPLRWNPRDIGRFMLFFGPLSSLFDLLTFVLMWKVFGAQGPEQQAMFQSGWFVVGLLTQTLVVHLIRTPKLAFVQSMAALPLLLATAAIMAIGMLLPMSPLAAWFGMQALPAAFFPWLLAILFAYATLVTLMKRFYVRRFGWQ
jgi:Mg2+-importing ATPase